MLEKTTLRKHLDWWILLRENFKLFVTTPSLLWLSVSARGGKKWSQAQWTFDHALHFPSLPKGEALLSFTALPSPLISIKSLQLPPCPRSQLPSLLRFQAESLWPNLTQFVCVSFTIWKCSIEGWGVTLFAAADVAVRDHVEAAKAIGARCDRCIPEAVALMAFYRAGWPQVDRVVLCHVQSKYCAFLLYQRDRIEAQVTMCGDFRFPQRLLKAQIAKGRQLLCGLRDRYRTLCAQKNGVPTEAIPLLITGVGGGWDWRIFALDPAEFHSLGEENPQLLEGCKDAVFLGLFHLGRDARWETVHLHPSGLGKTRLRGLGGALRGVAAITLSLLASLSLVCWAQCQRARASTRGSCDALKRVVPLLERSPWTRGSWREIRAGIHRLRAQRAPCHSEGAQPSRSAHEGLRWFTCCMEGIGSWGLRLEKWGYRSALPTEIQIGNSPSQLYLRISARDARILLDFLAHLRRAEKAHAIRFLEVLRRGAKALEVRFTPLDSMSADTLARTSKKLSCEMGRSA